MHEAINNATVNGNLRMLSCTRDEKEIIVKAHGPAKFKAVSRPATKKYLVFF